MGAWALFSFSALHSLEPRRLRRQSLQPGANVHRLPTLIHLINSKHASLQICPVHLSCLPPNPSLHFSWHLPSHMKKKTIFYYIILQYLLWETGWFKPWMLIGWQLWYIRPYDKTFLFTALIRCVGNQFIIAIRAPLGVVVCGQYTTAKGWTQTLCVALCVRAALCRGILAICHTPSGLIA